MRGHSPSFFLFVTSVFELAHHNLKKTGGVIFLACHEWDVFKDDDYKIQSNACHEPQFQFLVKWAVVVRLIEYPTSILTWPRPISCISSPNIQIPDTRLSQRITLLARLS
jgi:hypothetical protein